MDVSLELRKFVVPEFVFGAGALRKVGRYARNLLAKQAMVVTDNGLVQAGWVERVVDALESEGIASAVFSDVTPNPKDYEVAAGVRFYREQDCDVIVAVGGGSPMDCAKAIGIAHANDRNILDFGGIDEVPEPGPPLICVPTTAGSSADVSQFAIITDTSRKVKVAIISKTVVPDVSLIDPETTVTMPAEITAGSGLDALVHAIEAYVSNASSPVTDLNAVAAIPLLVENLVPAIENPGDVALRGKMMMGSLLAGMAFSNAGLGLCHAMAHSLGGLRDLPHGLCNALLSEATVRFNYSSAPKRYDRIALAMGIGRAEGNGCDALVEALIGLRERAGIRSDLSTLGVTADDACRCARYAWDDPCLATNPREVRREEIEKLYETALRLG